MLNVTNHLIDDIVVELLESGIWNGPYLTRGNHPTWCKLAEFAHAGPCTMDRPVSGTSGIRGITVAMHTDGHIQVANGLYQRIRPEADLNPLKSVIADMLREITA